MTVPFFTLCPSETFILTTCPDSRNARLDMSSATDMPAKFLFTDPSDSVRYTLTGRTGSAAGLGCLSEQPNATVPSNKKTIFLITGIYPNA